MKFVAILLIGILLPLSATATATATAGDSLHKGMRFFVARHQVVQQGWQPYKTHLEFVKEGNDGFPYSSLERKLVNRGALEVSSCSQGKTLCLFYYFRGEQCLLLETEGEQLSRMKLIHWEKTSCPKAD